MIVHQNEGIVHLVAIAKNEDLYIEDWMIHYFNLGIDKICIYDNMSEKPLSELINNSIKLKQYFGLTNDASESQAEYNSNDASESQSNIEIESQSNDNIKNQIEVPTESLTNDSSISSNKDNLKIETKDTYQDSIKNKIEIKTWTGLQNDAYKDYWEFHKDEFDWLLVCDIDEFIDVQSIINFNVNIKDKTSKVLLENTSKDDASKDDIKDKTTKDDNTTKPLIKQLLEYYKNDKVLSLKCVEYGDNELIERDMSKSVFDVFNKRAYKTYEHFYKNFFNKYLIHDFNTNHGHYLKEDNIIITNKIRGPFIRHIRTYSLKEYLDQKYRIKHQSISLTNDIRRCLLSLYYYKINKWTEEKQLYTEKYRLENNIVKVLYICTEETYEKYKDILKDCYVYMYGKEFCEIHRAKKDFVFQGINSLKDIIYDFDKVVFIKPFCN